MPRTRARRSPSLLSNRVYDPQFRQLTLSHTAQPGKPVGYFIGQIEPDANGNWAPRFAIAVLDLEPLVITALVDWLRSPTLIADLRLKRRSARLRRQIEYGARQFADLLNGAAPAVLSRDLRPLLCNVMVGKDHVQIQLQRRTAISLLQHYGDSRQTTRPGPVQNDDDEPLSALDNPRIRIPVRLRRYRLRLQLMPPGTTSRLT